MKRLGIVLILLLFPYLAFGQGLEFRGRIGDSLNIVMTLHVSGGKAIGYYYYTKYEKEKNRPYMKVEGTLDDAQNISVAEIDMKKGVTGHLQGKFTSNTTIEGEWSNADGSRKMPFSVSTGQPVDEPDATGLTRLQRSGLDAPHIAANPDLLKALYTLHHSQTLKLDGVDIVVELFLKNGPQGEDDDSVEFLYRVRSGDTIAAFTQRGRADEYCCIQEHKAEILNTHPKLLRIEIPTGGNYWNADPDHLIDLEPGHFLTYLGAVTEASATNGNGPLVLQSTFDLFEYISFFCHADAPGEWVFHTIRDGALVPDTAKNEECWKNAVANAAQELAQAAPEARNRNKAATDRGVHAAIEKLIVAHLSGREDEGWKVFRQDLLSLSADGVLLCGNFMGLSENGIRITDVEKEMREGFQREERNRFIKDL